MGATDALEASPRGSPADASPHAAAPPGPASPVGSTPDPTPAPPPPSTAVISRPVAASIEITGSTPLYSKLNEYVIRNQVQSFAVASILITIIMVFLIRSVFLGIAIMIPNWLPVAGTYGVMGWLGIPLDFMTAVIAVAAIGVAVDSTIHLSARFRRAWALGQTPEQCIADVMSSTARALVVTTLVLVAGFSVLSPSVLAPLAMFGKLMAFCLFLALIYDLLMTPALLIWIGRAKTNRSSS
jgi:predicted RND superfamily exporter protein